LNLSSALRRTLPNTSTEVSQCLVVKSAAPADLILIPAAAERFGFSTNQTGGHMARSIMLPELSQLFRALPLAAKPADYRRAIVEGNALGKPTFSSREKTYRHLAQHYSLDPTLALFRLLRRFAQEDSSSLPLMAATCSFCRDPQFRQSFTLIRQLRSGELLTRERMEAFLEASFPTRFSAAMKKSLAQNVITSWKQAGHLRGRIKKVRIAPQPRLGASVYSMAAGYLLGLRGQMLTSSVFVDLVSPDPAFVTAHLAAASGRGWIRFRQAGGIVEVDLSPLFTEAEQQDQRQLDLYGAH